MAKQEHYIPALSVDWLTPLYDPLLKWGMHEGKFKRRLIDQAQLQSGYRLLDLGCGTGTLTILIKQLYPQTEVIGLDGDRQVMDIARRKAAKASVQIAWDEGMAFQLPYPDNSFDRVLSSLVFHHLIRENKERTFREIERILRPGGELHLADFGKPRTAYAKLLATFAWRFEAAADNLAGTLPEMMQQIGFEHVAETTQFTTIVGGISLFRAWKRP